MDWIRRFLQGMRAAPSDEELGRRSSVYPDENRSRKSTQLAYEEPNVVLETSEKLMEFRMLVGITTHPSFKAPRGFSSKQRPVITSKGRPAPNLGIYPSVVANEFKTKKKYVYAQRLITIALVLQLIVAAALTALGAANGSHGAVTVFGGINTVIAGFLTYLKGSGLPNRLKYYLHEWTKVREYIEARERDLGICDHDVDIHREVNIIRAMYEEVKADIEANTPDRFVGSSGLGARSSTMGPSPALAAAAQSGAGTISSVIGGLRDARNKVEGMAKDIDGSVASSEINRARGRLADDVSVLKGKLQQKLKEVEQLEKGVEDEITTQAKTVIRVGEKEAYDLGEIGRKELADMEKDVEEAARSGARAGVEEMKDALRDEKRG